jgi:hypothetical protein
MNEFRHIVFYEKDHSYINVNNQKKYTSVTSFIKTLFPEFDSNYWAVYKHLERQGFQCRKAKHGIILANGEPVDHNDYIEDAQYILDEWADIAKAATDKGTAIHLWLENAFNNKITESDYDISVAKKFWQDHSHMKPVHAECIVADDELELAGQVDRPFHVVDNVLDLYDYKTNKEIKFENKFEKGVDNLDNCSFNIYMLQLNIYREIIERNTDYKIRFMRLVHLTDEDYQIIDVPKYNMNDIFRSLIDNKTNN